MLREAQENQLAQLKIQTKLSKTEMDHIRRINNMESEFYKLGITGDMVQVSIILFK
jgi:hypothetical protein